MKQLIQKYNVAVNLFLTLVFALNTLAPLSLLFNQDTLAGDSVAQELFSGKILICTSSGYKYVSLEDFKNGNLPDESDPRPHCPLCAIAATSAYLFIPEIYAILFSEFEATSPYYSVFFQRLIPSIILNKANPRAPPIYSFFA